LIRDAFQHVYAAIAEFNGRSCGKIFYGTRDKNFAWLRRRSHASGNVNGNPADIAIAQLDFSRVHACANLNPQFRNAITNTARASNRTSRPVECGDECVTNGLNLAAAKPSQLFTHQSMMRIEKVAPPTVAELRRPFSRADDVGKKHSRQNTIEFGH
jgi:hypothetical protein